MWISLLAVALVFTDRRAGQLELLGYQRRARAEETGRKALGRVHEGFRRRPAPGVRDGLISSVLPPCCGYLLSGTSSIPDEMLC
jgi:hypothetical protein